jgi:hypothetical protein
MDWPRNPRPTVYSTRAYGRVGAFFTQDLPADEPLHLRYRVTIRDNDPTVEELQREYDDFASPIQVKQ